MSIERTCSTFSKSVQRLSSLCAAFIVTLAVSLISPASAQDYVLQVEDQSVAPNSSFDVSLLLTNLEEVAGFQLGVCHDPALLSLEAVAPGAATVVGGSEPDFFDIVLYADGFTAGVIVSLFGFESIPPGQDQEVLVVSYGAGPTEGTTTLELCETLGTPSVDIDIFLGSGAPIPVAPVQIDGTIDIASSEFVRGDVGGDGIINLGDPIAILLYLFQDFDIPCVAASDFDASGSTELGDAISLLLYINGLGPLPAAPFPSCGPGLLGESCAVFSACP